MVAMTLLVIHRAKQRIANRMKAKGVTSLSDVELKRSLTTRLLHIAEYWRREDYKEMFNQVIKK